MLLPVKTDRTDLIVSGNEWSALREQCAMLVKSQFLPESIKTAEQALAIALKGREIGVPPMQAFAQIHVIKGHPAISAELMMALIFKNIPGAKVDFERYADDGCTVVATRPGHKPAPFTFTLKDAETAQLTGNPTWKKYPRAMCRSRAISEMARSVFPDAIMGCSYTPEEMGAAVNEDGDVIDVPAPPSTVVNQAQPTVNGEPDIYNGSDLQKVKLMAAAKRAGLRTKDAAEYEAAMKAINVACVENSVEVSNLENAVKDWMSQQKAPVQ